MSGGLYKFSKTISSLANVVFVVGIALIIICNWGDISKLSLGAISLEKVTKRAVEAGEKISEIEKKVTDQQTIINEIAKNAKDALRLSDAASERIGDLSALQEETKEKLEKINQALFFTNKYMAATVDDRHAFDLLKKLAKDKNHPSNALARQAVIEIVNKHDPSFYSSNFKIPWKEGFDPGKLDLSGVEKIYKEVPLSYRPAIIEFVWKSNKFTKHDKMTFMINIIKNDDNLKAVEYAGRFFAQGAGLKIKPLGVEPMLDWWEKNQDSIKGK